MGIVVQQTAVSCVQFPQTQSFAQFLYSFLTRLRSAHAARQLGPFLELRKLDG